MASSRMIPLALVALAVVGLASRAAHPHGAAPAVPPVVLPACCGPCTKTICVREPEKVTPVKTVYRCKTKTICLPYCGGKHCGGCDSGECGKTRQVRVLIKRFVKEERGETPCVPKELPAAAGTVTHGATPQPLPRGK